MKKDVKALRELVDETLDESEFKKWIPEYTEMYGSNIYSPSHPSISVMNEVLIISNKPESGVKLAGSNLSYINPFGYISDLEDLDEFCEGLTKFLDTLLFKVIKNKEDTNYQSLLSALEERINYFKKLRSLYLHIKKKDKDAAFNLIEGNLYSSKLGLYISCHKHVASKPRIHKNSVSLNHLMDLGEDEQTNNATIDTILLSNLLNADDGKIPRLNVTYGLFDLYTNDSSDNLLIRRKLEDSIGKEIHSILTSSSQVRTIINGQNYIFFHCQYGYFKYTGTKIFLFEKDLNSFLKRFVNEYYS